MGGAGRVGKRTMSTKGAPAVVELAMLQPHRVRAGRASPVSEAHGTARRESAQTHPRSAEVLYLKSSIGFF